MRRLRDLSKVHPVDHDALKDFVVIFLLLLLIFCLSGCAGFGLSSPDATSGKTETPIFEMTLQGSLDGLKFEGAGIGNASTHHSVVITSSKSVDMFTAKTCHRSVDVTDAIEHGLLGRWFDMNKSFEFQYDQSPGIEDNGICPLEVCSYSKTVGQLPVDCAMFVFHNAKFTLPAQNICNGSSGPTTGTMICKSQIGLIERVQFQGTTFTAPAQLQSDGSNQLIPDQCKGQFIDAAQTIFQYTVPADKCSVEFMQRGTPPLKAVLTVVPFNAHPYQ